MAVNPSREHLCPVCNGTTYRVSRRFIDLIFSLFFLVHRYRCRSMRCDWEGINLKQRVIAEGVETSEQLAFLKARQCAGGQGFLFSRPIPPDDFAGLLVDEVVALPR